MSNDECSEHPLHAVLMANTEQRLRVILTLRNGDTIPVVEAQRRVLESLDGTAFEIVRQPENFPVLTLTVGEEAFCRLIRHDLVTNLAEDRPEPAIGG